MRSASACMVSVMRWISPVTRLTLATLCSVSSPVSRAMLPACCAVSAMCWAPTVTCCTLAALAEAASDCWVDASCT
ncbi:hypothetical protein [Chromobacterium amazonense]|uniref:hypothetical protein n=1 Tax=Chromobacterium amazonense TaxID=1382803 RepID=UPI001FD5EAF1|nr:hypothetical protein [Chromobacterium amazonense]